MDRAVGRTDKIPACMELIFTGRQNVNSYIDNVMPGSVSAVRKVDQLKGLESGGKKGGVFNGVRPL